MCFFPPFFGQNLTDDECSEDKMNNLQFYLNKYPSAPDGKIFRHSHNVFSVFGKVCVVTCFFYHLAQMSTLNPFLRNGRMTTKDWREFTRTFSGMYVYACGVCFGCVQSEVTKLMSSYTSDLAVGCMLHALQQGMCYYKNVCRG